MSTTRTHDCPAAACTRRLSPRMLMCRPHWFMVPKRLRDTVWLTWRNGLGAGSPGHADAIAAAVEAVNANLREKREAGQ